MNDQGPINPYTAPHIADSAHTVGDLPGPGQAWPPVPQLRHLDRDMPALLLLSLAFTHRQALDYVGLVVDRHSDPQDATGEFVQRATGRRYRVHAKALGKAAVDPRPALQVPAAWIDLFADALDCLRQAEPFVSAVSSRDPELARLAARIRLHTQENPES